MPAPADQRILGHVLVDLGQRAAAVALRSLSWAQICRATAVPGHLDRREVPGGMARHAGPVVVVRLMAGVAVQPGGAEIAIAAHDVGQMQMAVVVLRGRSPAGWQLTQRGCRMTLPASANRARERSAWSAMSSKALAGLSCWAWARPQSPAPSSSAPESATSAPADPKIIHLCMIRLRLACAGACGGDAPRRPAVAVRTRAEGPAGAATGPLRLGRARSRGG